MQKVSRESTIKEVTINELQVRMVSQGRETTSRELRINWYSYPVMMGGPFPHPRE